MHLILSTFVVIIFASRLSVGHESSGLTFELPDNEKMCFHQDFEGSKKYIFEFKVLRGGNNDVDVRVQSPNGILLYEAIKRNTGVHSFDISWGTYTFCFSNEFSSYTHKIVYFEIRPEEHKQLAVEGGKKAPSANTQLEESMETVHSHTTRVMMYQKLYRLNEANGRYRAEELNQRVQWWSLAQSVIILFTGLGEIFILKRFFMDRPQPVISPLLAGLKQPEVVHAALSRP